MCKVSVDVAVPEISYNPEHILVTRLQHIVHNVKEINSTDTNPVYVLKTEWEVCVSKCVSFVIVLFYFARSYLTFE